MKRPLSPPRPCPHCDRLTLTRKGYTELAQGERDQYALRIRGDGTCLRCDTRIRRRDASPASAALAYEGGWVNRGGVMYPTAPARPTGRPPKPLIMPPADRYAGYAAYRRGDRSQWAIQGYREYQRHDQRLRRARKKAA